jgi:hypothetical protein
VIVVLKYVLLAVENLVKVLALQFVLQMDVFLFVLMDAAMDVLKGVRENV